MSANLFNNDFSSSFKWAMQTGAFLQLILTLSAISCRLHHLARVIQETQEEAAGALTDLCVSVKVRFYIGILWFLWNSFSGVLSSLPLFPQRWTSQQLLHSENFLSLSWYPPLRQQSPWEINSSQNMTKTWQGPWMSQENNNKNVSLSTSFQW